MQKIIDKLSENTDSCPNNTVNNLIDFKMTSYIKNNKRGTNSFVLDLVAR